jgi:hypothetical protein
MTNQLLNDLHDVFPPIQIALPTRGIFYPEGVFGKGVDPNNIQVGTLGILDEFKYRDPFLLVSGNAMEYLIKHLCGDQIQTPEALCEIDVETILIAARLSSYGPSLKLHHICTQMKPKPLEEEEIAADPPEMIACQHENTLNIDLYEFILRYGPIEHEERFEVLLPRVGQTVYLKPTPYRTTIQIMRNVMGNRRKLDELNAHQEDFIMDPALFAQYEDLMQLSTDLQIQTLLDCIYAVKTRSGVLVEDPKEIMAWIFELPKSDHDIIAKQIQELTEEFRKISLIRYECEDCHGNNEFNLQMNAEILFLAGSPMPETSAISSMPPAKNKNSFRPRLQTSRKPHLTSMVP